MESKKRKEKDEAMSRKDSVGEFIFLSKEKLSGHGILETLRTAERIDNKSYHIVSYYFVLYHIKSYHIISYSIMLCHVISCHIISYSII